MTTNTTINDAAFSYVIAYVDEYFDNMGEDDIADKFRELSDEPTNIKELTEWLTLNDPNPNKDIKLFKAFYKAMQKVCKELVRSKADYIEYSGSEDRMWYRAWERVLAGKGYTAEMNFFGEASCVNAFFDVDAITQEQLDQYKTNCTLQMGMEKRWQTNGMPDVQKILNAVDKKWRAECFDFSVLWGFEEAANPATKSLAILKYS